MNSFGSFYTSEEILEQGQSLIKKVQDQTVKSVKTQVNTAVSQVTGSSSDSSHGQTGQVDRQAVPSDHSTQDFVRDLYAPSNSPAAPAGAQAGQSGQQVGGDGKTPEEQAKIAEARKKLDALKKQHREVYYEPTFNRPQPPEEKPVERIEREEQEKMMELEEKKKKEPEPLAVRMANQRAEKFPGASG